MTQRTRSFLLNGPFANGQRPDQNDFNDVWESFLNYQDDPISLDGDNNYVMSNALRIGNTAADNPGTIRFTGTAFEFRESTGWESLGSGSGGAFQPVGAASDVSFTAGNVGINTGAATPDFRLQVSLGNNTGEAERVRFGAAAIHNRSTSSNIAYFSHINMANDSSYALSQSSAGDTFLNARTGRRIFFRINNNATTQMRMNSNGDFQIGGAARKPGGGAWLATSDERTKKKIRPFKDGLKILQKINPIQFEYNGKGATVDGSEHIGVSGNKVKKVAPYMVSSIREKLNPEDEKDSDVLIYDSGPLIYIAVNAIKELSSKIEELEFKLQGMKQNDVKMS